MTFPREPAAAVSAARLAAEAAFSLPPQPPSAAGGPVVIVRRARVRAQALAGSQAEAAVPAATASDSRLPRVFRVDARRDAPDAPDAPAASTDQALAVAPPDHAGAAAEAPAVPRRRKPVGSHPGPVRQVFQAPARPDAGPAAEPPAPAQPDPFAGLAQQLASLEPVFESIRRAQSFRFLDEGHGGQWQALSRVADELLGQIQLGLSEAGRAVADQADRRRATAI